MIDPQEKTNKIIMNKIIKKIMRILKEIIDMHNKQWIYIKGNDFFYKNNAIDSINFYQSRQEIVENLSKFQDNFTADSLSPSQIKNTNNQTGILRVLLSATNVKCDSYQKYFDDLIHNINNISENSSIRTLLIKDIFKWIRNIGLSLKHNYDIDVDIDLPTQNFTFEKKL